jgi:amino acid transporter
MIGQKISVIGTLFLAGFYICSFSSSVGSFYTPSRMLQMMAKDNLLPKICEPLKRTVKKNVNLSSSLLNLKILFFKVWNK